MKIVLEGMLTLKLDDGRVLSEYVVSAEHGARVLARWAEGACGNDYQAAHGGMVPCARPAGHAGYCSHREERGD